MQCVFLSAAECLDVSLCAVEAAGLLEMFCWHVTLKFVDICQVVDKFGNKHNAQNSVLLGCDAKRWQYLTPYFRSVPD